MEISIIICTYNRSGHLKNVLKSLSEQNVTKGFEWEIIVVDNNSTDDTFDVVKAFQENSNVPVKYIKEEKQGLSYARNRGITSSKGKYIAFTDDDALVDYNWVAVLYETFQRYECEGVGGRIHLKPVKELPRWLKKELWGFLACLDYGDKPFQIINHNIYGTNMAFSREIFDKVGYFDVELGRKSYMPVGGEEIDIVNRILQSGGAVYYQPMAEVYHIIEKYKLRKQYFRQLHYYDGFSSGKFYKGEIKRHFCGIPFFVFPQFVRSIVKYLRNPSLRMQMNIWWLQGFMVGRASEYRKLKKNLAYESRDYNLHV